MAYIDNDGVKIWYTTFGDKKNEALVLLTGAALDYTVWQKQIDHLKERYYVIAIDNRGCGKSDCPEYKYTTHMLCEDVEFVLYEEGIFQFNLAGFSMGGLVAQKLTERNVEKVLRLVLMNTTLGSANPEMVPPDRAAANMYLFHSLLSDEDLVCNVMDFCFGPDLIENNPDFYASYSEKVKQYIPAIPYQAHVLLDQNPLISNYNRITMPVLAIYAEDDPIALPANAKSVMSSFPNARNSLVPGFHMSPWIQFEKVNSLLDEFLILPVDPEQGR